MMSKPKYILYCDGACSGNPGPGGWGYIALLNETKVVEAGGHVPSTTNNQMELQATTEGLTYLAKLPPGQVRICCDSQYVLKGITEWIHGWIRNQWRNSQKEPVANQAFWQRLWKIKNELEDSDFQLQWVYVKGHASDPLNNRADKIAVSYSLQKDIVLYEGGWEDYSHRP